MCCAGGDARGGIVVTGNATNYDVDAVALLALWQ
jgi:hypothetical protein